MAGSICGSAQTYLERMASLLASMDAERVDELAEAVYGAWLEDRLVIVFGNGGSAATASHWVADLVKTAAVEGQRRLRAMSPVDNTGLLTALGNDLCYDATFVYQLETFARSGDLVVGISASGNSPNVVQACQWAKRSGLKLATVTGFDGGKIGFISDVHVNVPSDNYGLIEDMQLAVGHMVAQALKSRILEGVTAA